MGGDGRESIRTRRDTSFLGREEVEFFAAPEPMFGCRHVPLEGAIAGVVVCSPVLGDLSGVYLPEIRLGRHLARLGVAVQRFHYRGSGYSDGEAADRTLTAMIDDTRTATDHLRDRTGVEQVGFLGTREGAVVAAAVAHDRVGTPIALWEPAEDLIGEWAPRRPSDASDRERWNARPHHGARQDALWVEQRLGLLADGLVELLGPRPRPLLFAPPDSPHGAGYRDVVDDWRQRGFDVAAVFPPGTRSRSSALVERTAMWFRDQLVARIPG